MKTNSLHLLLIIISLSFLFSGCAYKRLFKEGKKYEDEGMLELSIEKYNEALQKKTDFVDARIALNRTLTRYAHDLEQQIDENYIQLDDNEIVENYLKLKNFKKIADNNRISLEISNQTKEQYTEAQQRYLTNHYAQVTTNLENEDFDNALLHILAIKKVNSSYKDIKEKEIICRCEPLYRNAQQQIQLKKYRTAYSILESVIGIGGNYKDSKNIQNECLEKGILTVAFTNFSSNDANKRLFAEQLIRKTTTNIQNANALFLKVVDINNTEQIVREQKIAMQNGIEIQGNIIPVRSHLSFKIPLLTYTKSTLTKTKKKGYIKEVKDDKSVVYHKVYYYECAQSAESKIMFTYELRSTETGLTLLLDNYTEQISDKVCYIEYSGKNISNLRSGYWENGGAFNPSKDYVNDNFMANLAILQLINARKTLKTKSDLQTTLCNNIANKISDKLIKYNPEK